MASQGELEVTFEEPNLIFLRPGDGEEGPTCGDTFIWICPNCGEELAIAQRCMRRVCPNCGGGRWAWRQAKLIYQRLMVYKRTYNWHFGLRHLSVSFDDAPVDLTEEDLERERRRVYETLATMGFVGGEAAYHKWRKRCLQCGGIFEAGGCHPSVGFEWVESPHWHVVGFGRVDLWKCGLKKGELTHGSIGPHEHVRACRTVEGAVVKIIPPGKGRSWVATIKYVLDHAAVADKHHAYTWFGELSYNKMNKNMELYERFFTFCLGQVTERLCPQCGTKMVPLVTIQWAEEMRERFSMPWPGSGSL